MYYNIFTISFLVGMVVFTFSFVLKNNTDKIITSAMSCVLSFLQAFMSLDIEFVLEDGSILQQYDYVLALVFVIIALTQILRIFVIPYKMVDEGGKYGG
jgi:hypothetical protein